jgi:RNA polymerase sigma-70 factor (ECF subfamily)
MWNRQSRFTALVNAFTPDLYRYAYWLCGDSPTAEDLVQETFMRAWRALDKLREERSAKAWLITTLRRENARRFARKRPETGNVDVDTLEAAPTYDTGTEAFVLRQALNELAVEYREPLVLQIIGGYDIREIAAELGLSKGAVTTRLFRARQKLRHALTADESPVQERITQ